MKTVYENPSDGQFERQMVSTLKTEIKDFPAGQVEKQESPDFIIRAREKTVGIEVTRAINPNDAGPTPLPAIRTAQSECLNMVREMLRNRGGDPLEIKVNFRDDYARIDIQEASRELFHFIQKRLPNIDDTKAYHYYDSGLKYVRWISIQRGTLSGKKWLNEHRVGRIYMTEVNTCPHGIIQKAIDSKNTKLRNYKKQCDECWLIIGVNELTTSEAITVLDDDDSAYSSDFARTYFIRGVEGRVWRLNTAPSNISSACPADL